MAVTRGSHWEVRTDGDNANGGAFNPNRSGATKTWDDNYTYGPSYQVISYTDLYSYGTQLNTLRSDSRPFVAADIGHVINLTGGSNIIAGRYEIIAVSGGVATLDANCWSAQNTQKDGSGRLGGAIAHPVVALDNSIHTGSGTTFIWVREGTYDWTAAQSRTGSFSWALMHVEGYQQQRMDRAARPVWRAIENNVQFFNPSNTDDCSVIFVNVAFSGNGRTGVFGLLCSAVMAYNCTFTAMALGIGGAFNRWNKAVRCLAENCETGFGENCSTVACKATGCTTGFRGRGVHSGSVAFNCGRGFYETEAAVPLSCFNCASINSTNEGFYDADGRTTQLVNCVAINSGSHGFRVTGVRNVSVVNCVAVNNGGFGFNFAISGSNNCALMFHRLRGHGNTSGLHNIATTWASTSSVRHTCADDIVALTGSPFISSTDLRLKRGDTNAAQCRAQFSDPPNVVDDWEPKAFNAGLARQFDGPEQWGILIIGDM